MSARELPLIALLGDDRGHRSHQELNALRPALALELEVVAEWVPTDRPFDIRRYDGVWLVPGSPYASDDSVLEALAVVRSEGIPFLGTCGGMQYAVMEFVRSVLGVPATHAESDGERPDNVVSPMACSLRGEERTVVPVPGPRHSVRVVDRAALPGDALLQLRADSGGDQPPRGARSRRRGDRRGCGRRGAGVP